MEHVWVKRLDSQQLAAIADFVTSTVAAPRIVLFGSAMRGGMDEHSDVDVAVLIECAADRPDAARALNVGAEALVGVVDLPVEFVVAGVTSWERSRHEFGSLAHEV